MTRTTLLALLLAVPVAASAQTRRDTELRSLVARLLPVVERVSGLEARRPIHASWRSRAQLAVFLRASIEEHLEDEIEPQEAAFRALGLLPDTFTVAASAVDIDTTALAGYYDPKTDTLYVIEGGPLATLHQVVAHEMTHAIQDQNFHLDSLLAHASDDDHSLAVRAAVEGHALVTGVLVDLGERLHRPVDASELIGLSAMMGMVPAVPAAMRESVPRIVRETMVFPYIAGGGYVQTLRAHAVEVNTLGQFQLSVLLMEHLGLQSEALADGWGGDRYVLLTDGARHALVWYVVWDDGHSAFRFARAYQRILARRHRAGAAEEVTIDGHPGVRIVDADAGVDPATLPPLAAHALAPSR